MRTTRGNLIMMKWRACGLAFALMCGATLRVEA